MKVVLSILLIVSVPIVVTGQKFVASSDLQPVVRDGFYKILLRHDLSKYSNSSFSNLRILDSDGVQAPFIVEEKRVASDIDTFVPYTIDEKILIPDSCTLLTLENESKNLISNISLIIKNAAVLKKGKLFGSDDKVNWYALKDKFNFGYIQSPSGTSGLKIIDFPSSDYKYYRIWINDQTSAPLNIIKVGYFEGVPDEIHYDEIPVNRVSRVNEIEKGKSNVTILLDTSRIIEKITWKVQGTPFYQRSAALYTRRAIIDKKGKTNFVDQHIIDFEINSRQENVIFLPALHVDNLIMKIENGDSPPLEINEVSLFQVNRYLVTWLKKDESYVLKFGDSEMEAPSYDLTFFKDSLPDSLLTVEAGDVQSLITISEIRKPTVFTTRLFIWIAMIVVIAVLGFMSLRLIRETKPSNE